MEDRAVPNLPSRNFDATAQFYGAFGFDIDFRDDDWLVLRSGSIVLEFFPYPDLQPQHSSFMCSIRVADVDILYARMLSTGVPERPTGIPRLTPVKLQPWGQRAGFLIDLDGTQLHLIEDLG